MEIRRRRVEALRRQCEGVGFDAEELESEDIAALATGPCVQLVDINDIAQGPAHVALQLCTTAELNEDQMRAVALVAKPLQEAWDKSRVAREHATTISPSADSNKLPLVGALVRLLIVGGGGCGKTRIFNKVLIPLLTAFYGTEGVLKQASTNKAARLRHGRGKTIHATNKLTAT